MSRRLFATMAWRDAWRSKWRSLLMLVMVALPVAAVTTVDVLIATTTVDVREQVERELGPADALVTVAEGPVQQMGADPGSMAWEDPPANWQPATARTLQSTLGRPVDLVEVRSSSASVDTDRGKVNAEVVASDWSSPLASGLSRKVRGRHPARADEVAVNASLADRGPGVGETLVSAGERYTVVGIVEDPTSRAHPHVFTTVDNALLPVGEEAVVGAGWLVRTEGGVSWADVVALNAAGMAALSREVVENPPPADAVEGFGYSDDGTEQMLAVVALIVVMALLEVVLLAGPGFAVSARRMQRSLALMAVSGATPRQARRAVMATAWVMGSLAAVTGIVLGTGTAWLVTVVGQRWYSEWFPPLDLTWWHLLLVAGFGLLSAVLAAAAPAWLASRLDVVAVLGGRRGDPPARLRSPLLGLVLVGVGIALAARGAVQSSNGEFWVACSAVLVVLGVVLVIPVVLTALGRLAGRLPLAGRYTVRDAARHRLRTAPAVAAVVATVAAATALGIALSSDEREAEQTYTPQYQHGEGIVAGWEVEPQHWTAAANLVAQAAPDAAVEPVLGVPEDPYWVDVRPVGVKDEVPHSYGGWGTSVLVGDRVPGYVPGLDADERAKADEVLARGGAVYFFDAPGTERAKVVVDDASERRKVVVPAVAVTAGDEHAPTVGIISPSVAEELEVPVSTVSLHLGGEPLSKAQQDDLEERLAGLTENLSVQVERGYQRDPAITIVIWALVAAAALLMLGGTLTSTFLSLADARADLSTLAAVGAAPRTRRRIAAGYALVIAGVGSVLGVLVGLVPGIAVSFPLTNQAVYGNHTGGPTYYLVVPWPVLAVVLIGLPLLTAAIAALCTRARLPVLGVVD